MIGRLLGRAVRRALGQVVSHLLRLFARMVWHLLPQAFGRVPVASIHRALAESVQKNSQSMERLTDLSHVFDNDTHRLKGLYHWFDAADPANFVSKLVLSAFNLSKKFPL
jgi:hypothetical protein